MQLTETFHRSIGGVAYKAVMQGNAASWSIYVERRACGSYHRMPAFDALCTSEQDARNQITIAFGLLAVADATRKAVHELAT